ncbi:MAG: septum formation initiator family protein [Candidatus Microbacterium phytovorans]|uniref:Septum formation initiator family protein n=1 Tax=Candidatus Microbacterium phytovorans TaxID=3121374 RepID=A0AAJ5W2R7_9MICO|nr:septum formation initiator family protein [Microbacterium sp.]WEK14754.1 MAG: septum formation initiator family protein [Microbacterium sp.]
MTTEGAGRSTAPAPSSRRVDVRDWVGGVRLSAFTGIMLGLVVLAAFVLVPSVGTYLDQRNQIAALERSVQVTKEEVVALEAERERWADPAYITSQARERLYYVRPGEVVYLVDDDLPDSAIPPEQAAVSDEVQETRNDWMSQLLRSVTGAGLAQTASSGD